VLFWLFLVYHLELRVCEIFYYPPAVAVACLEVVGLRGKPWSIDEERRLRTLVSEGKRSDEIAKVMDRSRISVRAKVFNLGLFLNDAAASLAASPPEASAPALAMTRQSDSVVADAADLKLKLPERLSTIEEMLKVFDGCSGNADLFC
jgi:hypothetical protein